MKISALFGNQLKIFQTLTPSERKIYKRLISVSLLSVLLEFLGVAVIYVLLLIVFEPTLFLESLQEILGVQTRIRNALAILFTLFVIKTISSLFVYKGQLKLVFKLSGALSDRVFNQSFNIDLYNHKKIMSSDRLMEVNTVTNTLPFVILIPAISALSEMIFILTSFTVLLTIKPFLVLALVFTLIPQSLALFYIGRKKLKKTGDALNEKLAEQNELVAQSVSGYSEINLLNLGKKYRNDLQNVRETVYAHRTKSQLFSSAAPQRTMELLTVLALCIMAIYFYGFNQTKGFYSTLALFAAAAFRLLPSFNRVVMGANTLSSFASILDLIPKHSQFDDMDKPTHDIGEFKSLEIKSLNFGYEDDSPLFSSLNFKLHRGEFVGLYGPSGVGKTTLINLIIGFYELPDQQIFINGKPIGTVKRNWHNQIGYIKQDAFVTAQSVEENVAFGSDDINQKRVVEILKQVKLYDWVKDLPQGIKTPIGDQGSLISGGQKQRLAVARALYRNAEVLICDEITTSLDEENKAGIISLIEDLHKNGTTIIMISHDKSSFENASVVYKLAEGKLIQKT